MAYRLPSERVPVGEPSIEVERITAWPVQYTASVLVPAFFAAKDGRGQYDALREAYGLFLREAQPSWEIVGPAGPIPVSLDGLLHLPHAMVLGWISAWADTLAVPEEVPETAVDAVVPPGPARDELNKRLARVRAQKTAA